LQTSFDTFDGYFPAESGFVSLVVDAELGALTLQAAAKATVSDMTTTANVRLDGQEVLSDLG
jgi:hypothetical protein